MLTLKRSLQKTSAFKKKKFVETIMNVKNKEGKVLMMTTAEGDDRDVDTSETKIGEMTGMTDMTMMTKDVITKYEDQYYGSLQILDCLER